jgi:N-acetyltransferase
VTFPPYVTLENNFVRLEPLTSAHREGLRAACNADPDIWDIYPVAMNDPHFDDYWATAQLLIEKEARKTYAVLDEGVVVGTTSYYHWPDNPSDAVCIGATYYQPSVRGTKVNPAAKLLLMQHAVDNGAGRVFYHVDCRNLRSQAAVLKLGGQRTRIIEKHMTTWTGHVRDTAEFEITRDAWPDVRSRLESRL